MNLADGIIGDTFNVHIICTTNSSIIDLDTAITRPGRLSQIIRFDLLSPEHANLVYKNLSNEELETPYTSAVSLAEVYYLANQKNKPENVSLINNNNDSSGNYI